MGFSTTNNNKNTVFLQTPVTVTITSAITKPIKISITLKQVYGITTTITTMTMSTTITTKQAYNNDNNNTDN